MCGTGAYDPTLEHSSTTEPPHPSPCRTCRTGAYDPTPEQLNDETQPALLAGAMPPQLHARVRMVAVLREPASRLLSWYNHKVLTTSVVLTYLLTT